MKEAGTKVIDTLTQDDLHGAFQKLFERYNKCIAAGGDYFEGDSSFMCVLSIKVPIQKSLETYLIISYIYIYISKVKLATIVEGKPKALFSIATTPRCRGGRYSFPVLLYFTLDPYLIMLSVNQGGIKYHFLSLWGLNPDLPGHWRTL